MADVTSMDRELAIEWVVSDDLRSVLATNVSIVRTEHETTLSFFETVMPPYQSLASATSIRARCVARVVIASSRLREIADLFVKVAGDSDAAQRDEGRGPDGAAS